MLQWYIWILFKYKYYSRSDQVEQKLAIVGLLGIRVHTYTLTNPIVLNAPNLNSAYCLKGKSFCPVLGLGKSSVNHSH